MIRQSVSDLAKRSCALANNLKRDLWTNEDDCPTKSRIRFCWSRATGSHAPADRPPRKLSAHKQIPAGDRPRGFSYPLVGTDLLLQDHRRERIDVGLQHHEKADKARQHDGMPEHITQDCTFMPIPVGGGGGDDDRLRV